MNSYRSYKKTTKSNMYDMYKNKEVISADELFDNLKSTTLFYDVYFFVYALEIQMHLLHQFVVRLGSTLL